MDYAELTKNKEIIMRKMNYKPELIEISKTLDWLLEVMGNDIKASKHVEQYMDYCTIAITEHRIYMGEPIDNAQVSDCLELAMQVSELYGHTLDCDRVSDLKSYVRNSQK